MAKGDFEPVCTSRRSNLFINTIPIIHFTSDGILQCSGIHELLFIGHRHLLIDIQLTNNDKRLKYNLQFTKQPWKKRIWFIQFPAPHIQHGILYYDG